MTVLSNSSSVTSSAGVVPVQPALLTRMSTRPNVSFATSTIRRTSSTRGDVGQLDHRLAAQLLDLRPHRVDLVVPPVGMLGEHEVRAGLGQAERDGPADALRRAGDDRDLVLQAEARIVDVHSCSIV